MDVLVATLAEVHRDARPEPSITSSKPADIDHLPCRHSSTTPPFGPRPGKLEIGNGWFFLHPILRSRSDFSDALKGLHIPSESSLRAARWDGKLPDRAASPTASTTDPAP
jgi:hypothetical protein